MNKKHFIKSGLLVLIIGFIAWKGFITDSIYEVDNAVFVRATDYNDENFIKVYFELNGKETEFHAHKTYTNTWVEGLKYKITVRPNKILRPDNEVIRATRPEIKLKF